MLNDECRIKEFCPFYKAEHGSLDLSQRS